MITPLRQLAADHAAGRIDDAEYRRRRRELLHQLAGAPDRPSMTTIGGEMGASDGARARFRRVALGALLMIVLALALQWGHRGGEHDELGFLDRSAHVIIEDPGWGSAELARLQRQWNALSPAQRTRARTSPWFGELTASLGDRLHTIRGNQHEAQAADVDVARLEALLLALQGEPGQVSEN